MSGLGSPVGAREDSGTLPLDGAGQRFLFVVGIAVIDKKNAPRGPFPKAACGTRSPWLHADLLRARIYRRLLCRDADGHQGKKQRPWHWNEGCGSGWGRRGRWLPQAGTRALVLAQHGLTLFLGVQYFPEPHQGKNEEAGPGARL